MATEWFNRKPGEPNIKPVGDDPNGPQMIVLGPDTPDWIRIPPEAGPPLAGLQLRVTRRFRAKCPLCQARGTTSIAKILELESPTEEQMQQATGPLSVRTEHSKLHTSECVACGKFAVYWAEYHSHTIPPDGDVGGEGGSE